MNRTLVMFMLVSVGAAGSALAQPGISQTDKWSWSENCGWMNWHDGGEASQGARVYPTFLSGFVWCENTGWLNLGDGTPANGSAYANTTGADSGVNIDLSMNLSGLAWGENIGWVNFAGGAIAGGAAAAARLDLAARRLRGYAWAENVGWINLDDGAHFVGVADSCGSPDFDCDGDTGTDADIQSFFACLAGVCPPAPCLSTADFDGDGDVGTDMDIEAFFRVLAGGGC